MKYSSSGVKHIRLNLFCLLYSISLFQLLYAQDLNEPILRENIRFKHITVNNGLSSNDTSVVHQDSYGFIWIGTINGGLNKFDGKDFTNYLNDPQNPESLSNNYIWRIFEDEARRMWLVSWGGGVSRYDHEQDIFINFSNEENNPLSLSSNFVWSVLVDREGTLWVGTDGGLDRWDENLQGFIHYRHNPEDPMSLSHNSISMIKEREDGLLWISTYGGGINLFDPETGRSTRFIHDENNPDSLINDYIWTAHLDDDGFYWLGTEDGLDCFDPVKGIFIHGTEYELKNNGALVTAIFRDSQGNLWVGTSDNGLHLLKKRDTLFTRFIKDYRHPGSLGDNTVWDIHEDKTGAMWFATFNGVDVLDNKSYRFSHFLHYPGNLDGLSSNTVQAFLTDTEGILWIGTRGGGLNRFDPETQQFRHYVNDPTDSRSLLNNNIQDIIQINPGFLWLATGSGVDLFDIENEVFHHFENDPENEDSFTHGAVWDLEQDTHGNLWAAMYGGGIDKYNVKTGSFTHYKADKSLVHHIISEWGITLGVDGHFILIGSEGGLSVLHDEEGQITNYSASPGSPGGLSDNTIHTIHIDDKGRIWIGTNYGINLFDRETGTFTIYSMEDGLAGNHVASIIDDHEGYLWIGTNNGLSRFDPENKVFRNFDKRDGLQGNQFKRGAVLRRQNGELLFGGTNGISTFFPSAIVDNEWIPPVFMTEFGLFNKPVTIGEDSPLKKHINLVEKIELNHRQNVFSFKFAALNYLYPEKNQYAYRMKGFEDEWNYVDSSNRIASYMNLDPGDYTFQVKGSNNDGKWNHQIATVELEIIPPYWETLWFRFLIAAGFLACIFLFIDVRFRTVQRHKRELEREIEEKEENEFRFQTLLDQAADAIFVHDKSGRILEVNQTACSTLGYSNEELLKLNVTAIERSLNEDDLQKLWVSLIPGKAITIEGSHMKKDGTQIPVELRIGLLSLKDRPLMLALARDISKRKLVEEQLRQSQKMEAIGTLAGGIAHDFNNILGAIIGFSELAQLQLPVEETSYSYITEVLKSAHRAKEMVRQILTFSRKNNEQKQALDLSQIILEVLTLIHSTIPSTIEIQKDLQRNICPIMANSTQMHQVLMNICTNAAYAMGEEKGILKISLSKKSDSFVELKISDTGTGMPEEVRNRIFEPFFTTKGKKGGTGMGLSVVHGIIADHGGSIQVSSNEGTGTIFTIQLPCLHSSFKSRESEVELNDSVGGNEHILLVDDEEPIITMGRMMLESLGYRVSAYKESLEALENFKRNPGLYDLLITDQVMPKMTGIELTREFLEINNQFPVILSTGYSGKVTPQVAEKAGVKKYLYKPFTKKELAEAVREVLDSFLV